MGLSTKWDIHSKICRSARCWIFTGVLISREKKMKHYVMLITLFLIVFTTTNAVAANPNANWRALVSDAHGRSDTVLSGTVQSVEDQTSVDGGHVYELLVTDEHKGSTPENVSVRAGGYLYVVPLKKNEDVILFLRKASKNVPKGKRTDYILVEADKLRPMAFRISGDKAHAVDGRLKAEFASVKVADLKQHMVSIKP